MNSSSDVRDPVELLAEEFTARRRRGERPTLDEYCARHPELADEIRDLCLEAVTICDHLLLFLFISIPRSDHSTACG